MMNSRRLYRHGLILHAPKRIPNGGSFAFSGDNPAGDFGYTEADNAFTYADPGTSSGSFVRIEGLSGDLTLVMDARNASVSRLRMSGFQIVQVPEPTTGLLGVFGAFLFLRRRR